MSHPRHDRPHSQQSASARLATWSLALLMIALATGCTAVNAPRTPLPVTPVETQVAPVPRELQMVSLPRYVIEPPDLLLIQAIKVVPKSPHKIESFDGLLIRVRGNVPEEPIDNTYVVDPEGLVDLGPSYGKVKVIGMTTDEAQDAVRRQLARLLAEPEVSISLAFTSGAQQIAGEHLVGPDGRVNLGTYGSVYVTGMTLTQAKEAIESQLSNFLEDPQVVVDMFAYNSKKYYVITEGGGFGDSITDRPITGNETVLDAISSIGGLSQLSSTKIWIARPAPGGVGCEQILPVDYEAITHGASTATNYQLMPRDRLFISVNPMTRFDSFVTTFTRPFERIIGFTSLGVAMLNRIERFGLGIQ